MNQGARLHYTVRGVRVGGSGKEGAAAPTAPMSRQNQFFGQTLNLSGRSQQPKWKKYIFCIY